MQIDEECFGVLIYIWLEREGKMHVTDNAHQKV